MDFRLTTAKFAFKISTFSQTCIFFHGRSQNITLYRCMKYMFSPPVGCISEHAKTMMAIGKRKAISTVLNKKLSRKNNIYRNHRCYKFSSVKISAPADCGHLSSSSYYLQKPQFQQNYWKEFVLLHLYHTSGDHLKRTSIRPPDAEKICTKRHVTSILQAS